MISDVYEKFLKSSEEFIFAENKPEKSDIIFVPGNGYPQMAEEAAEFDSLDDVTEETLHETLNETEAAAE